MCSFLVANWLIANLTHVNYLMQPRGPDGTTQWSGYGFEFVHNLLHMTGERTLQPFHDPHARVVALFNGEIYNWRSLQGPGKHFRTDGDALIHEYELRGTDFVRRFDGEFAIVLLDFTRGRAVLAVDAFGTKPLWFSRGPGGSFAVASYRSSLERLGLAREEVRALEPNSVMVLEIQPAWRGTPTLAATAQGPPPPVLERRVTFEFDLRQHKTHTRDWQAAFLTAVRKRTQGANGPVALCLSDGYDSGAISLALGRLGVPHSLYSIQAREDAGILASRLDRLGCLGVSAGLTLVQLSVADFAHERHFLGEHAERTFYRMRGGGYTNVDDKAAAGLSWIYRRAAAEGRRLFLSGSGADETISDYGLGGQRLEFHSTLRGIFPEELAADFPWLNFFMGTQRDYLAKEEATAGAHGVEARYPFLDRAVVQEYLWLTAQAKNSAYKAPIRAFFEEAAYPFVPDTKRGFSADRNLIGGEVDEGDAAVARVARSSRACAEGSTLLLHAGIGADEAARPPAEASGACFLQLGAAALLALVRPQSSTADLDPPCSASAPRRGSAQRLRCLRAGHCRRSSACPGAWHTRRWRQCRAGLPLGGLGGAVAKAWAKQLEALRPFQQAKAAEEQGVLAPTLSLAVANGHVPLYRVAFLTSCMEEGYFWTYCLPLLSSFDAAFGQDGQTAAWGAHIEMRVLVAAVGVATASLERAQAAFSFVGFVVFEEAEELLKGQEDATEAEDRRRTSYQSLKLDQYMRLWQEHILGQRTDFVVCMDSDMLVVRPFGHVFEFLNQHRVDVAFTYYDGKRQVPWGTAEELATTRSHGYVRLQGGMLLMRNSMESLHWFAWWVSLTRSMLEDVRHGGPQQERWSALHREFKGPSQAALAFLLAQGQFEIMENVKECCSSVRTIMLEPLNRKGAEVEVRMLGLPARYMNDAESTEDGALPPSAHIVHLKGHWWRSVLPEGREDLVAPTRSYQWNRETFELWRQHRSALRPGEP